MTGYVHSFESLAAVDGDGLRCAVFLAGCPLRCVYCHNPDTWQRLSGKATSAEELVKKISRYMPYFGEDGGVTFSGGEPFVQAEFIRECAERLEGLGIRYALDTSGAVRLTDSVRYLLENAEQVLLDIKFWDDESYIKYTGHGMKETLDTLEFLNRAETRTRIRTVVVPGINDSAEMLEKYLPYIRGYACVDEYELLGFHTLGFFKYEHGGMKNPLAGCAPLPGERLCELQNFVNARLREMGERT